MPDSETLEILKSAKEKRRGIGAFNIVNLSQMIVLKDVAESLNYPLMMQTSVATASFYTPEIIVFSFKKIIEGSSIPIALHLDHCRDLDFAKRCAEAGYSSIMVDFSKEPYEENVKKTADIVAFCRDIGGVAVEGEVGIVPGVEDDISSTKQDEMLCTPEIAYNFIRRTKVDLFAPAIGTAHGVYRTKNPRIDHDRLRKIDEYLKDKGIIIPLVVHGCSGLPEATVKELIKSGASKFNISTDIKQRILSEIRNYLNNNIDSNNTLELEKITKNKTIEEANRWMKIFIET